jgi:hypothetical protein
VPVRNTAALIVLLGAIVAGPNIGIGCGRKTAVKAPQLVAPEAIRELDAKNAETGIQISWERPTKYLDGSSMYDLAAFRIERSVGSEPFAVRDQVIVEDRYRFQKIKRFRYLDTAVEWGATYAYRVFSLTDDDDESAPSNEVEIVREVPAVAAEAAEPTSESDKVSQP